jgi:hypothetical protein
VELSRAGITPAIRNLLMHASLQDRPLPLHPLVATPEEPQAACSRKLSVVEGEAPPCNGLTLNSTARII